MRLVVLAAAALLAGCAGGESDERAVSLLDGTPAETPSIELEGVDGKAVLTSKSVLPVTAVERDSVAGSCLHGPHDDLSAEGPAVVRIGVETESVTFTEAGGRAAFGCSNTPGPREDDRRWCGLAYGARPDGVLRDPRLSMGCQTASGELVGFAWIEPTDETRIVAVEQPDYWEVYEVAAGLPVRIATVSGVDVETSSATFQVSEHDGAGRRLREYELEAFVAG